MSSDKPRSLIVLTALRFSEEYGRAALASARDHGEDVVLCLIIDRKISDGVAGQLADVGFLGERLMHELSDTMVAEYREQGLGHLEDLSRDAKAMGLEVGTRVVDGPFLESVRKTAVECGASRILAARAERGHLSRVFFGSEINRLLEDAPCPVELFLPSGRRDPSGMSPRPG